MLDFKGLYVRAMALLPDTHFSLAVEVTHYRNGTTKATWRLTLVPRDVHQAEGFSGKSPEEVLSKLEWWIAASPPVDATLDAANSADQVSK